MTATDPLRPPHADTQRVIEIVIRVGALAVLVALCARIISPFVHVVLWGIIIAVAAHGPFLRLRRSVGQRTKLAAFVFVLLGMLAVVLPTIWLSKTAISGARSFAADLGEGHIVVPPPPESVSEWPLVGKSIQPIWLQASENLEQVITQLQPELVSCSRWLLGLAGSAGMAILQLAFSIVIAGVLLVSARACGRFVRAISTRLVGEQGDALAELARGTVKSVATGILGVALIQALLAGLGFAAIGLPAAGLWALAVLLVAIVQAPTLIVILPLIVYVFSTESMPIAVIFAIWELLVGLIDNVLKPILFGRGVKVPASVIFLGAIGGMLMFGIVGLFTGSVILAVGYVLLRVWLYPDVTLESEAGKDEQLTPENAT